MEADVAQQHLGFKLVNIDECSIAGLSTHLSYELIFMPKVQLGIFMFPPWEIPTGHGYSNMMCIEQ